jgi:hypothetical protein
MSAKWYNAKIPYASVPFLLLFDGNFDGNFDETITNLL